MKVIRIYIYRMLFIASWTDCTRKEVKDEGFRICNEIESKGLKVSTMEFYYFRKYQRLFSFTYSITITNFIHRKGQTNNSFFLNKIKQIINYHFDLQFIECCRGSF